MMGAQDGMRGRRRWGWGEDLARDLAYAARGLRRDAAFSAAAIVTLALAVGANVAVFAVIHAVLLRPLPLGNPQELEWIAPPPSKCGLSCETYSADAFEEFRAQAGGVLSDVTGYYAFSTADNDRLAGRDGEPRPVTGLGVVWNFFQVLQVAPALGRGFRAADAGENSAPVALLSYGFWMARFGGDAHIVGQTVELNGRATTIAGVLPRSFDFGAVFAPSADVQIFQPLALDDIRDDGNTLTMIGRRRAGVTPAAAQAEANLVAPRLDFNRKYPQSKGQYRTVLTPLDRYVTGSLRAPLTLLWCGVGLILLIACANLSNLLLARGSTRSRELALRAALGAGRGRVLRQLLAESLLLAAGGGALGLALAGAIAWFLARQSAIALPLLRDVRVGGAEAAWSVLAALAAVALFGVFPGLKAGAVDVAQRLREAGPNLSAAGTHERARSVLAAAEVALACLLLTGAGLLLRSFMHAVDVDLGFQPDHAATIRLAYRRGSLDETSAGWQRILERVQAVPGVAAAGIVDYLPFGQNRSWGPLIAKGGVYRRGATPEPLVYVISPGFLRAMGMRLEGGRDFRWSDDKHGQQVAIVNEAVARALWPGRSAVGQWATMLGLGDRLIVGVIADVHQTKIEKHPGWQIYFPATQEMPIGAELVVRSRLPPAALQGSVVGALRALDPAQAVAPLRPIREIVNRALSPRWFFLLLVGALACLGLGLAALGVYGLIAYSVARRAPELGIRAALGATPARLRWEVVGRTLGLSAAGIAAGTVLSLLMARAMASLLFGVAPLDPATFLATILVMGGIAALAGYIPARRAAAASPLAALRGN